MPLPAAGDIFMVNPRLTALAGALPRLLHGIRCSLITKLALVSGSALMLFFFLWSSLNIGAMKTLATEATMSDMDRLGNTINLGLHYAMLTYSPQSIREIIKKHRHPAGHPLHPGL
jgi:histidine kinase